MSKMFGVLSFLSYKSTSKLPLNVSSQTAHSLSCLINLTSTLLVCYVMFALESYFYFKICEQIYHCPISQQTLIPFTGFSRILFAVRSVAKAVCVCYRWSNLRLKQNKSNMSVHCKHYDLFPEFSPYIEICTFSLICFKSALCAYETRLFFTMTWFPYEIILCCPE